MTYIQGYIPKNIVRKMLDNYHQYKDKHVRLKERVTRSVQNRDGISGGQLNKVMLDQAIDKLPRMEKACCRSRWILELHVSETISLLGISRNEYYKYCDQAVEFIYRELNGEKIGVMELLRAINSETGT